MSRAIVWVLAAVLTIISIPASSRGSADGGSDFTALFQYLTEPPLLGTLTAHVRDFTLRRDVGRFRLTEGDVYALPPYQGRVCMVSFVGTGVFTMTPPMRVEQDELERRYGRRTVNEELDGLVLVFADTTYNQIARALQMGPIGPSMIPRAVKKRVDELLDYVSDKKQEEFLPEAMTALLNGHRNGFFFGFIHRPDDEPLAFVIDPYARESVQFMRRARKADDRFEVVNSFSPSEGEKVPKSADVIDRPVVRVRHYEIESHIDNSLDFTASARLEVASNCDSLVWVEFSLAEMLEVDAISADGAPLPFVRGNDSWLLWVKLEPPMMQGETRHLVFEYGGDLIERTGDWLYLQSSSHWYPRADLSYATFDLTFHTPEKYGFASVGKVASDAVEDRVRTSRWIVGRPRLNASFNIGLFKEYEVEDERIPPVTVLMARGEHRDIGRYLAYYGIGSGRDMERQVGADIANSMAFFSYVYGAPLLDAFYASEIPYGHGEAFPGLIHLSWATFQRTADDGSSELFRAHEVAHQWWGIGVDFETYRDQWISEAFAHYSGLWYVQVALQDNEKFFRILKDWREELTRYRERLYKSTEESAPISLGYRTDNSGTPGEYDLIVYKKGAWVLHMLRNMLLDLNTMSDDRFSALMSDFYETYKGRRACTADFERICSRHFEQDMGWFFDQWVHGSKIPRYEFAYTTEKVADDQFKVSCRVEQIGVPDDFQMYIPMLLDFGDDRVARIRVFVRGPVSEFPLPVLPLEPEGIVFNDLESVLCEVDHVDWD